MKKLMAVMAALMIMVCGCTAAFAETKVETREDAMKIALYYTGLNEDQVTFTKVTEDRDDGRMIWEVEFRCAGVEYDLDVDMQTGRIIEADRDYDDHDFDFDDWFDFD